jgi:hypothetical protein
VNLHDLPYLDYIALLFDVAVGEFADVNEAVLMDADVDKGSELRDIGDDAFEGHAGLQAGVFFDVFFEGGGEEFVARVAAGLAEFFEDVVQRADAGGESFLVNFVEERGFGHAPLTLPGMLSTDGLSCSCTPL